MDSVAEGSQLALAPQLLKVLAQALDASLIVDTAKVH